MPEVRFIMSQAYINRKECKTFLSKDLPLNMGDTRNAEMAPDVENCPKKVCIRNMGSE